VALRVVQLLDPVGKKHEIGLRGLGSLAVIIDDGKLERRMNVGKKILLILKIIQSDQAVRVGNGREEVFRGHVRRDARGHEQADAALGGNESVGQFGEDRVGIDVAFSRQRILAARAAIRQHGIGRGQRLLVALIKGRILRFQFGDHLAAFGGVGGCGDFRGGQREELALLEFDAFPRRIANDAIEARLARGTVQFFVRRK